MNAIEFSRDPVIDENTLFSMVEKTFTPRQWETIGKKIREFRTKSIEGKYIHQPVV